MLYDYSKVHSKALASNVILLLVHLNHRQYEYLSCVFFENLLEFLPPIDYDYYLALDPIDYDYDYDYDYCFVLDSVNYSISATDLYIGMKFLKSTSCCLNVDADGRIILRTLDAIHTPSYVLYIYFLFSNSFLFSVSMFATVLSIVTVVNEPG